MVTFASAKYCNDAGGNPVSVLATMNGKAVVIPVDPANSDYRALLAAVQAATVTIQAAG